MREGETERNICLLCRDDLGEQALGLTSFPCRQHKFHKSCAMTYARHCLLQRKIPIPCPAVPHDGSYMTSAQAYGHLARPEDADLYDLVMEDNRVAADPFLTFCTTPGCRSVLTTTPEILKTAEAKDGHTGIICGECHRELIVQPFSPDDRMLQEVAIQERFRACPMCRVYIKAEGGCRKMTCVCGCQFCYYCGRLRSAKCKCESEQHDYPDVALAPSKRRTEGESHFRLAEEEGKRRAMEESEMGVATRRSAKGRSGADDD